MSFDASTPGTPASPAGSAAPVSAPESAPSTTGTPATPSQDLFDVTINGKTERVALDELRKGYSRHSDYTRKTQELAERERLYQTQLSQYEAALQEVKNFLEDKERLKAYYDQLAGEAANAAAQSGEPVTQQTIQQLMAQQQQAYQYQLQQLSHQMQVNQLQADYTPKVEAKIQALKGQYPELNSPRTERLLRMEVLQRQPGSLDEALSALDQVAAEIAGDLGNVLKSRAAQGGAPASNPLTNGIEPRGGSGPMPPAQPNFKSVRDPGLRELVMQDLINATKGR